MKKRIAILMVLIVANASVIAQSYNLPALEQALIISDSADNFDNRATNYLQALIAGYPDDTSEGGLINSAKRWIDFMTNRVSGDAPHGTPISEPITLAMKNYLKNSGNYCTNPNAYKGNWRCLGPYINHYNSVGGNEASGRIESIWASPLDDDYILAGAETGGLWKTTDGGLHWNNITDVASDVIPGTIGVLDIAVDPLDEDVIYLNTGELYDHEKGGGYLSQLIYSTDKGQSWQEDLVIGNMLGVSHGIGGSKMTKVAYMPGTDQLFLIFENKIVYKSASSANWQDITPSSVNNTYFFTDIEFTKLNTGKAIFSTYLSTGALKLFVFDPSLPSGSQWNIYDVTLPSGYSYIADKASDIFDISIAANDDVLFISVEKRMLLTNTFC